MAKYFVGLSIGIIYIFNSDEDLSEVTGIIDLFQFNQAVVKHTPAAISFDTTWRMTLSHSLFPAQRKVNLAWKTEKKMTKWQKYVNDSWTKLKEICE